MHRVKPQFLLENLWIWESSLSILEEFQCVLACPFIQYNFVVLFLRQVYFLFMYMLPNIFSHGPPLWNPVRILWSHCWTLSRVVKDASISSITLLTSLSSYLRCIYRLFCWFLLSHFFVFSWYYHPYVRYLIDSITWITSLLFYYFETYIFVCSLAFRENKKL